MASHDHVMEQDGTWIYFGLIAGGLTLAAGLVSLYWSFGWPGQECLNCNLAAVGSDGVDDLALLPAADYSIGLIVAGVLAMVVLNAGAWHRTNGW